MSVQQPHTLVAASDVGLAAVADVEAAVSLIGRLVAAVTLRIAVVGLMLGFAAAALVEVGRSEV